MPKILLVDDEENMLTVLEMLFRAAGYATVAARSASECMRFVRTGEPFDLVISDLKMPDMDGICLLRALREHGNKEPFILITAYGTIERAVEAMKLGAVDVVTKPFNSEQILNVVKRVCRLEELEKENAVLRSGQEWPELVHRSPAMRAMLELMRKVGPAPSPVLIIGESGTGKEVVARGLHRFFCGGDENSRPFVSVNCPAVPEQLLESELFGYRRGAFTGASKNHTGRVALAAGGTLFFDEIGDLPLSIQPKLLRLLENKTYEPLGCEGVRGIDVRVVCATNKDLKTMVAKGAFREDLYYRINTITINVIPLRERPQDIAPLADFFVARYSRELCKKILPLAEGVVSTLERYHWPGNVRELRNVIERAVVLCAGDTIGLEDIPAELRAPADADQPSNLLEDSERRMLLQALQATRGNISEAARKLGVSRNTMRYRMQKYGLGGLIG